jgi:hypothetical protein
LVAAPQGEAYGGAGNPAADVARETTLNTFTTSARRITAATAVSVLGATMLAGAASAETAVFRDARGDMAHGADIQRVRVVNEGRVKVKVVHRNLVRSYKSGSSLAVFLDTDRHRQGPEFVFQGGTFDGADYALLRAKGWKAAGRQAVPMRCGYDMKLDYVNETALVRIDRSCLGDPRQVRVEVKTGGELREGAETTTVVDWLGNAREFTRWVKRG